MPAHYEALSVPRSADLSEIKYAYRRIALKSHPDKTQHFKDSERLRREQTFKDANNAWEILQDSEKRAKYDKSLPPLEQPKQPTPTSEGFGQKPPNNNRSSQNTRSYSGFGREAPNTSGFGNASFGQTSSNDSSFNKGSSGSNGFGQGASNRFGQSNSSSNPFGGGSHYGFGQRTSGSNPFSRGAHNGFGQRTSSFNPFGRGAHGGFSQTFPRSNDSGRGPSNSGGFDQTSSNPSGFGQQASSSSSFNQAFSNNAGIDPVFLKYPFFLNGQSRQNQPNPFGSFGQHEKRPPPPQMFNNHPYSPGKSDQFGPGKWYRCFITESMERTTISFANNCGWNFPSIFYEVTYSIQNQPSRRILKILGWSLQLNLRTVETI